MFFNFYFFIKVSRIMGLFLSNLVRFMIVFNEKLNELLVFFRINMVKSNVIKFNSS